MPEDLLELQWRLKMRRDEYALVSCQMVGDNLRGWRRGRRECTPEQAGLELS
jgi:hypothetical protein